MTDRRWPPPRYIAFDVGGTLTEPGYDPEHGQKPITRDAVLVLHALHAAGMELLLASNTLPEETRWPVLEEAGVDHLFMGGLLSASLRVAKPDPLFYRLVLTLCGSQHSPGQVVFVGDRRIADVIAPMQHGMRGILLRPGGLTEEQARDLPAGYGMIRNLGELPYLLGVS